MRHLCFFCLVWIHLASSNTDIVIFSYDRPMQLCALLESIDLNVEGICQEHVIYRVSESKYEEGYALLQREFPHVLFHKQDDKRAKEDFKPLVLSTAFSLKSRAPYILFAVDDIVITRSIDLLDAANALEEQGAYACFFRLGLDIEHCYMVNQSSPLPQGRKVGENYFAWHFSDGTWDWNYPNNVDFTLYRKKEIAPFFRYAPYTFPNDLEAYWAHLANHSLKGICPLQSCLINIPMNVVSSFQNRQMRFKTKEELIDLFLAGYRMDILALQGVKHNSPHFEIEPFFIDSRGGL